MTKLRKVSEYIFEIPKEDKMLVPGRIYASDSMIEDILRDESLNQVKNAAYLPGIVKASIAMPDIHYGYGLPIGGVVATDVKDGVVTPGGVGFDINCGVRLIVFDIEADKVRGLDSLANKLFKEIPCGVGEGGKFKFGKKELAEVMTNGSKWAYKNGLASEEDLYSTESGGCMSGANPELISSKALERGYDQVGTLGSGNHFLEIGKVDDIFDPDVANKWGLSKGKLTLMIHSGSRGLGHQICSDYLKIFEKAVKKYGIDVKDIQLACAPIESVEGKNYISALKCAANFAWANRQVLQHLAISSVASFLGLSIENLKPRLIYDVAHNIVKFEKYNIDKKEKLLLVHRKGATRALYKGDNELPEKYKDTGQPVIIPGDMGRYSFVLCGGENAESLSFNSACHGAGRVLSRNAAIKMASNRNIAKELLEVGVYAKGRGKKSLMEEMPEAYKDVYDVVDVVDRLNIANKIAKLKPLCVIKG
ncbi:RtcB family protein [Deferribacteraceae bacterium V6Fe1]|nr:RtcB family protein [Deferribacteraceae bacterium V6Fe1]